jgi:hypothetical protein
MVAGGCHLLLARFACVADCPQLVVVSNWFFRGASCDWVGNNAGNQTAMTEESAANQSLHADGGRVTVSQSSCLTSGRRG